MAKKFKKFLLGTAVLGAIAGGIAYYAKYIKKNECWEDDFEDDFEDDEDSDEEEVSSDASREYVPITIETPDGDKEAADAEEDASKTVTSSKIEEATHSIDDTIASYADTEKQ